MKRVMVRYTVKPDLVADNASRIEAVFAQLDREKPAGLRYASFKHGDNFVHVASIETADGSNPLAALDAFKQFVATIKDRCIEPPVTVELEQIGAYRLP